VWIDTTSQSECEVEDVRGLNVMPLFFWENIEALALGGLAEDMMGDEEMDKRLAPKAVAQMTASVQK
jgi:hypothetical protein